jgi:hypothetical protein
MTQTKKYRLDKSKPNRIQKNELKCLKPFGQEALGRLWLVFPKPLRRPPQPGFVRVVLGFNFIRSHTGKNNNLTAMGCSEFFRVRHFVKRDGFFAHRAHLVGTNHIISGSAADPGAALKINYPDQKRLHIFAVIFYGIAQKCKEAVRGAKRYIRFQRPKPFARPKPPDSPCEQAYFRDNTRSTALPPPHSCCSYLQK